MGFSLFLKVCAVWLLMALFAVANGAFRDAVLVARLGHAVALPLSGISLSLLVFVITWIVFPLFGKQPAAMYLLIGLQWVLMTLLFEFVFGHYVAGHSWQELVQVFNLLKGNLFVLVLAVSLVAPYLVARIRGLLS